MINHNKEVSRDDLIQEVLDFASSSSSDLEPTLSVSEINEAISMAVSEAFSEDIWVKGEIQRLNFHSSGHIYFTLVDAGKSSAPSTIPVTLLKWSASQIKGDLREILAEDREVRLKVRPDFYAPYGKMSLQVSDIDTSFTLGNIALARRVLLEKLEKEGVLRDNALLPLPQLPINLVLITSVESAAYHDVIDQLRLSEIGFNIKVINALMQGHGSVVSVVSALKHSKKYSPDVILLCRGGGAKSDLACFDTEEVARAIIAMDVPVLTGLGHQIDVSVADLVAHISLKTPTACAQFLIEHVREATEVIDSLAEEIKDKTFNVLQTKETRIANISQRIAETSYLLDQCEIRLEGYKISIKSSVKTALARAHEQQTFFKAILKSSDPARILERGFSLTTDTKGKIVRSVKDVSDGDILSTRVVDGEIKSTVNKGK